METTELSIYKRLEHAGIYLMWREADENRVPCQLQYEALKAVYEKCWELLKKERTVNEASETLDQQRQTINKICTVCQKEFTPKHPKAEVCSPKCRQKKYRRNKKQKP